MKKIFGIFIVLFLMFSTSLTYGGNSEVQVDCLKYALIAVDDEQDHYGFNYTLGEWGEAMSWYLDTCEASGGDLGGPVFL